jgi:hypothetical protein
MTTHDVSRPSWNEFLTAFSRQHRAWLATVKRSFRGKEGTVDAIEQPLAEIDAELAGGAVSAIHIRLGSHDEPHTDFRIPHPVAVRVERTEAGADRALEIVDEDGGCTRMAFRVAAVPEMVDGVAPGET